MVDALARRAPIFEQMAESGGIRREPSSALFEETLRELHARPRRASASRRRSVNFSHPSESSHAHPWTLLRDLRLTRGRPSGPENGVEPMFKQGDGS